MAFHFPLEGVLHFRRSVEHQQELLLRAAHQQVARVRHVIEQVEHRIREMQTQEAQQLGAGTTAAELRFALLCESELHRRRQDLLRDLVHAQALREQQQKLFQKAHCERETFESLRDHQLREYARDAARREQRLLDDLFLARQAYVRRGQNLP